MTITAEREVSSLTIERVLLAHNYLDTPGIRVTKQINAKTLLRQDVLTLVSNLHYYGFTPSIEALGRLTALSGTGALVDLWRALEPAIKDLTGANREMDKYVVYKNFPQEVLEMSACEYWVKQILMYWGFDKENFAQDEQARPSLFENTKLKVLRLADSDTAHSIYTSLLDNKVRWTDPQLEDAKFLVDYLDIATLGMAEVAFRENGIRLISHLLDVRPTKVTVTIEDATDVLRLAALRSDGDISLRENVKFKKFIRPARRYLCSLLEHSKNLETDMAERQSIFKLLLAGLHPGDFKYPRLKAAYDKLYRGELVSYASAVERGIRDHDTTVLELIQSRPGDYVRRFHHLYATFGMAAVGPLCDACMPRLTNQQLVKLVRYVETINNREKLAFPPRGNWSKLQIADNEKVDISARAIKIIKAAAKALISDRLRTLVPGGFDVTPGVGLIKLQTSDQELASYGRGTVFPIPPQMTFLRTASYWENDPKLGVTWFDNGWNFFDSKWTNLGACCWMAVNFDGTGNSGERRKVKTAGAIFSGDPVNIKELKGRACQMIDLYPKRLREMGVRYAVWNILCYSRKTFDEATGEVLATLQWGEQAETGKLFEPSRAQMVFPLKGSSLTKYIAMVDLEKNQLIYLDANLHGQTNSASSNGSSLSRNMPAVMEYLDTLPTVADLLKLADPGTVPVVYSDADRTLQDEELAYVFRPENADNNFTALDLTKLL